MKKYDVVIVGAGPAGLKAGEVLSNAGKSVLILEKNKVVGDKVCAGGVTTKILDFIPKKVLGRSFRTAILHSPHDTTKINFKKVIGFTVERKKLGKYMANAARKAGAEIRLDHGVTKIKKNSLIVGNKEIKFDYLIGADGSNSIVRKSLGLPEKFIGEGLQYITKKPFKYLEFFFDVDKFGSWYGWIFPHKNHTSIGVGVGLGQNISRLKKNFDDWCKDEFDVSKAKFQAGVINTDYRGYKFKSKFLVGDAAGFASGLTGEGIYFAILSGFDVANKILNKNYKCENIDHILKVKKIEERALKALQINKTITKIEHELLVLLTKIRWIGEEIAKAWD